MLDRFAIVQFDKHDAGAYRVWNYHKQRWTGLGTTYSTHKYAVSVKQRLENRGECSMMVMACDELHKFMKGKKYVNLQ